MKELKQLRKSAGMTQQQLADAAGVSRIHLLKVENGQISPTIASLEKILKPLGCSVFIGKSGNPPKFSTLFEVRNEKKEHHSRNYLIINKKKSYML